MPIGAVAKLIGGIFQADATRDAAKTQAQAADRSAQLQYALYNETNNKLLPYLNTGNTADRILSANYFGIGGPDGSFNSNAEFLQPISSTIGAAVEEPGVWPFRGGPGVPPGQRGGRHDVADPPGHQREAQHGLGVAAAAAAAQRVGRLGLRLGRITIGSREAASR